MSGKDETVNVRFCPKCNGPMTETQPYHTLPRLGSHDVVDVTAYLAIEVFVCQKCRYVEIYSGGKGGAEE